MALYGINSSYESKYGSAGLRGKYKPNQTVPSHNAKNNTIKRKSKIIGNNNSSPVLPAVLLAAGTGFAVYKGHGKITDALKKISSGAAKQGQKIKNKYPNLSQAGKSLKKASEAPLEKLKTAGKSLKKASKAPLDKLKTAGTAVMKQAKKAGKYLLGLFSKIHK